MDEISFYDIIEVSSYNPIIDFNVSIELLPDRAAARCYDRAAARCTREYNERLLGKAFVEKQGHPGHSAA